MYAFLDRFGNGPVNNNNNNNGNGKSLSFIVCVKYGQHIKKSTKDGKRFGNVARADLVRGRKKKPVVITGDHLYGVSNINAKISKNAREMR